MDSSPQGRDVHGRRHSVVLAALLLSTISSLAIALGNPEPSRPAGVGGETKSAAAATWAAQQNVVGLLAGQPRALAMVRKNFGYSSDVHPLWTSQGCTDCHNSGHPFNLTGSAATVYPRVNQNPRVNLGDPAASLILTKPEPGGSHGGGGNNCFSSGSSCYDTILTWIQGGAPFTACSYSIDPSSRNHGYAGGSNNVGVTAGTGCGWTAVDNRSWITVTSGASGSGNGTVSYAVAANDTTSSRSGTITIADQSFALTQNAAPACTYSINPSGRAHGAAGGADTVAVTAGVGCAWTATEALSWVTIAAGASGSGNGTVSYSVAANTIAAPRAGNITIADKTFAVSQTAATVSGACVADATTACLLNGRFRAVARFRGVFDNAPADTHALRKPVTGFGNANFETVFFYFNSADNIEVFLKMLDQGNTDSLGQPTIAVLFGTATPLRVEVTITDTTNGAEKTYTSQFNTGQGATDFTAFVK